MYKKLLPHILVALAIVLMCSNKKLTAQNIAINSSGSSADPSAMLDVSSTNTGMLIPRVSLTGTTSSSPITSPTTSLMVYNSATTSDVTPGYYYWDGAKWQRMGASKFDVGFTNGGGSATSATTNYYYMSAYGTTYSTAQNVTPNMVGTAPINGVYLFTATSQCVLNKINLWLSFGVASRTFVIDCYKYTQVVNATTLPSGTALIASTSVVSSAAALGNTSAIINGNNTVIQPGDVICIMIKMPGVNNNLYISGSLEFINQQ